METNIRNIRIGDVLKDYGYVTDEQIGDAIAYQKENKDVRIGGALIALGYITEDQLLQALGRRLDIPVIDIGSFDIQFETIRKIPQPLAEKYEMLALYEEHGILTVGLNDPLNFYGIEDIRQVTGMQLNLCLVPKNELNRAIHYYYSEVAARQAAESANSSFEGKEIEEIASVEEGDDDTPIINLLNRLLTRAYQTNTSDIHIEPFEEKTIVRMRIDGVMTEYVTLQKSLHTSLIARIKILGNMDIAERRIAQDGHFRIRIEEDQLNVRVSVLPTVFGEKAVLRLLSNQAQLDYPQTFGMKEADYLKVKKMMQFPNGIIYFTGPTGSGKTTTLYMILEEISKRPVNVVTIEDPVEKNLPKINQTQVNVQAGLTFGMGLRALLRQDPDVIMVGETRDGETAEIAVRAAITGHLVFSTLHTNDAASTVTRLEDMGLLPYMVSSSLVGVVAQRLMRKVCPECGETITITEEEQEEFGLHTRTIKHAKGCPVCNYTGYKGRIAIHEILLIDKEIRKMIVDGKQSDDIKEYAMKTQGMNSLRQCAIEMVDEGISTVEELRKIVYQD